MHLKKNYLLHYYHLISAGVNAERNRFMSLFGTKEKKEIARLKEQLTPEQISLAELQGKIKGSYFKAWCYDGDHCYRRILSA